MQIDPLTIFHKDWALVSAYDPERKDFNTMTISWGTLGTLWSKPIATVYIKPIRFTHDFMEKSEYFTISFFDEKYRKDLAILGSKSKRDCDKLSLVNLTPLIDNGIVSFKESKRTIICKKIYKQDLDLKAIPEFAIDNYYLNEKPHTAYVGLIEKIIE